MDPKDNESPRRESPRPFGPALAQIMIVMFMIAITLLVFNYPQPSKITYSFFLNQLEKGNIARVTFAGNEVTGKFREAPEVPVEKTTGEKTEPDKTEAKTPTKLRLDFATRIPDLGSDRGVLVKELIDKGVAVDSNAPTDPSSTLLVFTILSSVAFAALIWFLFRRMQNQMMGGGFFSSFSRSTARRYEATRQAVTFKDVAGIEGVKADLAELVEFLRTPEKFHKLGGRIPKGVLLNGPPGTGKTLLARAIAGEAGVPFFNVNGSEFIQMFVGVGASRVRDLFKQAKDSCPSIIFIDEIDAVGRQRGTGLGGGNDEREQTLNQILSEMDGFNQTESVIVIAATNRPDILDPALLRPGRFDRHITVPRPTQKGRTAIFKVHVRNVPLADDVDLDRLGAATIGLTGADIRNIVNEAALWAARNDKSKVSMADFEYARDKVLMGPKREEVLKQKEKEKTAYHEAGHTITSWFLPGVERVHKVTIIPRGRSLGATWMLPEEDRVNVSEAELHERLVMMLGGREAERLIYDEVTVGAENDLERATSLARRMVMNWGMSPTLGPVSYKIADEDPFLGREMHQQRAFSEHTMEQIDAEVSRILTEASRRSADLLREKRDAMEKVAQALIEREEIDDKDITRLIGPSVQSQANGHAKPASEPMTPEILPQTP